jgi:hypothetical protein
LAKSDEQMALLVQRVSGSHRGHYFFPDLAGVGLSRNPYVWREDMDPTAGMLRLVLGLGTRAVDRVEDDYPRIVALDQPLLRPDTTVDDVRRYSQHYIDLLDTVMNDWSTAAINELPALWQNFEGWDLLAVQDHEASSRMRKLGYNDFNSWIVNFEGLLADTPLTDVMNKMLTQLETAYDYPVDIEFTVNFCPQGGIRINLLQCRPLQTGRLSSHTGRPINVPVENILFSTRGNFMGGQINEPVKLLIYVDPLAYIDLPVNDKYQVARIVGRINRMLTQRQGQPAILIGPGRWGTTTPSLGVPVSFAEICNIAALVEIASPKEGLMPELSFGTHFFQDLVETDIVYVALFPNKEQAIYNAEVMARFRDTLPEFLPDAGIARNVIKVLRPREGQEFRLDVDIKSRQLICHVN